MAAMMRKTQFEKKKEESKVAAATVLEKSLKLQEHVKNTAEQKAKNAEKRKSDAKKSQVDVNVTNAGSMKAPPTTPTTNRPASSGNRKRGRHAKTSSEQKKPKEDKRLKYLNLRVAKTFDLEDETGKPYESVFFGTIDRFVETSDEDPPLWHVQYDDDDEEEFDENDLKEALKLYKKEKKNDPKATNVTSQVESVSQANRETPEKDAMDVDAETPGDVEEIKMPAENGDKKNSEEPNQAVPDTDKPEKKDENVETAENAGKVSENVSETAANVQ